MWATAGSSSGRGLREGAARGGKTVSDGKCTSGQRAPHLSVCTRSRQRYDGFFGCGYVRDLVRLNFACTWFQANPGDACADCAAHPLCTISTRLLIYLVHHSHIHGRHPDGIGHGIGSGRADTLSAQTLLHSQACLELIITIFQLIS